MKTPIYISLIALIAIASISASTVSASARAYDVDVDDSDNHLMAWTADVIMESNKPLVLLMDTLYGFTRSDAYTSNTLNENVRWMDAYRRQLCDYYDRNNLGTDTATYSKAEAVMQYADSVWALDDNITTWGMIINNDVKWMRGVFRHYNELSRLRSICQTQEEKQLLDQEFESWCELNNAVWKICVDLCDLFYTGGTMGGISKSGVDLDITDAHILLYKKEESWLNDVEYFETQGVFPVCAKQLLINCCQTAYQQYYNKEYAAWNKDYQDTAVKAQKSIKALSQHIDKWIEARNEWSTTVGSDWSKHLYDLNTGELLIRLSNIVCDR